MERTERDETVPFCFKCTEYLWEYYIYISEGYIIPIKWEKTAHNAQTVYMYNDGTELKVNDGNTFIQICPKDAEIKVKEPEPIVPENNTQNNQVGE